MPCEWQQDLSADVIQEKEISAPQRNQAQISVQQVINCVCKDHRDKIKVPDPVVKDLISKKIVEQII